ncbi:MAG TPA: hypothetical protein DGT23_01010 [Micromonosporaceae bacterium]|nr:hypothetical protein [Micromonosporaceae bacterium]
MTRRRRQVLAGVISGAVVIAAAAVAISMSGTAQPPAAKGGGEMPSALSQHLEKLRRAQPGNSGMALEGPGSAQDAAMAALAYPGDTLTVAQMDRAKSAATQAFSRPFQSGKGKKGTWVNVGPSEAVYPFEELRNVGNYVPNEYIASGRTTGIVISKFCISVLCPAWISASGGGVWRTWNIRRSEPKWDYLGGPLGINAAGALSVDPNDPTGLTIYVGTGEANVCGSGCVAGVGLYKSTNGGISWTGPIGKAELGGKGIGEIVVKKGDKNTIYVGTTSALAGLSSVCCSGITRPIPDAQKWGLYKSTNGGATWSFIHNGTANPADCTGSPAEFANTAACSPRGVRHVELDPVNANIVYASSYARGVWRSLDSGATWAQIKPSLNAAVITTRAAFDVTLLPNGKTRMYVHEGNAGNPYSRLFRSDDVAAGAPAFTDLTSANPADPGFATYNLCQGQCWYDVFVTSPEGHPDIVYTGGSYAYSESIANKRAVILSTDAGVSGTDMTFDGTDSVHPNGLHPDQHDLVTNPGNPLQFFETNDGGIMRSSGTLVDRSAWCDEPWRGLTVPAQLARCKQMLSAIPSKLDSVNKGLNTLQFMSLSVSPHNSKLLQGGTQDNGTWENNNGNTTRWKNTMIGDGGQSGFDVGNPNVRFHNFFDVSPEVSYNKGALDSWIWTADPLFGIPGNQFYAPVINDPVVSGTMFAGTGRTVHRTKTNGIGNRTLEEANRICNSWTGTYEAACGDWVELGPNRLTTAFWGTRTGGAVAAVERTKADTSTAWAATTTGRLFITKNVDANDHTSVAWTRLDDDSAAAPNRFISSIYIDPANGNRAWVSYSGFNVVTPSTPGHMFQVTYDPGTGTSTWVDVSYDFGDLPATDLVRDDVTGDLYAGTDYGVLRLAAGTTTWTEAATGMPNVEIAGLTIVPGERVLYAASHGLGAWRLNFKD